MRGRTVILAVKLRIVGFIFLEYIVGGCQQHPSNGNDCFLMSPAFFQSEVIVADFRKLFGLDSGQSALDE